MATLPDDPQTTNTGELWIRDWQVVLGVPQQSFAYDVSGLDIDFRATRSLHQEPNTVELTIYNMSETLRSAFASAPKNSLLLRAGYKSVGMGTIFQGETRQAWSKYEPPEWHTTVRAGDGEKQVKARISLTFGAQVSAGDAMRAIAKKMGVKPGNLDRAVAQLKLRGVVDLFPAGGALVGNSWRELQTVARSAGLEVSIQDGALQFLDLGQPLSDLAVLVSADSGMIGSPEVNADGRIVVVTEMIPAIKPGIKIDLQAVGIKGGYRVLECEYSGQSRGDEWNIRSTCERY